MLKTCVVVLYSITGICAFPFTLKIDFPATMFEATRFESPFIVCLPVQYVPALISWSVVPGVIVAAAFVVTDAVRLTELLPAVPLDTYPAETVGVTETVLVSVNVFVPVLTDAELPEIVFGAVALPLETDFVACDA